MTRSRKAQPHRRRATFSLVALSLALLTFAPQALAAPKITVATLGTSASGTTGGLFSGARAIAVNSTGAGGVPAGTTYVLDSNNNRIQRFGPTGSFLAAWGWDVSTPAGDNAYEICTVAASCKGGMAGSGAGELGASGAQGIAVDQASGNVYVSDQANRRIDAFSATGTFEGAFGWGALDGSESLQLCTLFCHDPGPAAPATGNVPGGQFGAAIGGLAVDASNRIYVADRSNRRVDVFTPTLSGAAKALTAVSFTRAFGWGALDGSAAFQVCNAPSTCHAPASSGSAPGQFSNGSPTDLVLDSAGSLYALDPGNLRLQKFDATPAPLSTPALDSSVAAAFDDSLWDLAIDSNDHLFLAGSSSSASDKVRVAELDTFSGALLATHGSDLTQVSASGLALAPPSLGGNLYLSSANSVAVLNDDRPTIDPITTHTATTATFTGTVVSDGIDVTYHFEYSADNGLTWTGLPAPDADAGTAATTIPVSREATGLVGSQSYRVRLVQSRANGSRTSAERSFTTNASEPLITGTEALDVATTTTTLTALVNPENQATTYHFEYISDADYAANGDSFSGPNPPSRSPAASEVPIGSGAKAIVASRAISGLSPGTAYHFRAVATNPTSPPGGTLGPEQAFTTYTLPPSFGPCPNDAYRSGPSAHLPDCRAYEQATPLDKNGNDAYGELERVTASSAGDAVTFYANAGFPGGVGSADLPSYVARRGPGNWSTGGLLPPAGAGPRALMLGWTPDLSLSYAQVNNADLSVATLVERSADGTYRAIAQGNEAFYFDGASADRSKVFFEALGEPLAPGAANGKDNLYVYDRDTDTIGLVGVLPDAACAHPPCFPHDGSFGGPYDWLGNGDPGSGGAEARYYLQSLHAISSTGERAYFTAAAGQIYLRSDPAGPGAATAHVSATHKDNGIGNGGTDPNGQLPAEFMGATPDGSHAFFTSAEELTNDANTGPDPTVAPPVPAIVRAGLDGTGAETHFIPTDAEQIAVDSGHIYWTDPENGSIGRAEINGTGATDGFITGLTDPEGIAVDSGHIYWTDPTERAIGRADLSDGLNVKTEFISTTGVPRGVAVSATNVYWANDNGFTKSSIGRADLNGNGANSSYIPLAPESDIPVHIAVDSSHIYVTTHVASDYVIRFNLDGSGEIYIGTETGTNTLADTAEIALDASHVYWQDRIGNAIYRANLDLTGATKLLTTPAPIGIAVDASHLYWSAQPPRPTNPGKDLYRYDAGTGDLTDLSPDPGETDGAGVQGVLGVSEQGDYAYFAANGVLASNPGARGSTATPGDCHDANAGNGFYRGHGSCNLYLAHEGTVTFIARLDANGFFSGGNISDAYNWKALGGVITGQDATARVSADGETLLFASQNRLSGYDNQGNVQLYRYHAPDGELDCVSCNPTGALGGDAGLRSITRTAPLLPAGKEANLTRNLSADGERVFFESAAKLVAADVNKALDVYEWEAPGKGTCTEADSAYSTQDGGCLYLLSAGTGPNPSYFADASASGDDAFIFTRDQLVPQDTDSLQDVYDAGAGGGLVAQHAVATPECDLNSGACEGAATSPSAAPGAASAAIVGAGNPKPQRPKPCAKGKVRRHGRCTARHPHKEKHRGPRRPRRAPR